MEIFISREEELEILENEYSKPTSSLIIVYGRLRIGKTTLLTEFCKGKNSLYFLVSEESEAQNIINFKKHVEEFNSGVFLHESDANDWHSLFKSVVSQDAPQSLFLEQYEYEKNSKIVVVIDEFQYLGKSNRSFPAIFKKIWDTTLQHENIMVILCGSMLSLVEEQALTHCSPLYYRHMERVKLTQLSFRRFSEFFIDKDYKSLIELYAIIGGVPKYMLLFNEEPAQSEQYKLSDRLKLIYAIEKNILNPQSPLYEEPLFLVQREVSEIGSYFSILKTIAAGHHKLSSISASLGLPQTGLTKYLKTLIDLDILTREVPITEENPAKCKRGQYVIKDNFLLFWFKFVYPNLNSLEAGYVNAVVKKLKNDIVSQHIANIYKNICLQRMWELSASEIFGFKLSKVGRWWDGSSDIDIVALSVNKKTSIKTAIFGECKFTSEPMDTDIYYSLLEKSKKVSLKNRDRRELFVFFSISGYTDEFERLATENRELWLLS